ncbi:2-oxoglutarate dehydrogenase complex dihydrolipoyllysine-residue succinyltransferase [Brevundimonas subvibrioides]|uniref:Dihydrolipoyllysine-residue succinyltransferase component of 2-oxoglutarate dehydrogenase complex n=1 Tax=Brevundimonas subvibrioides (strain ATCC 15264 / DSM 4735 / LMG 14903 / NBRC 16000 / CB 81) TaxID=633149 RepID=D9QKF6_BRESC|nr:2-oxoglutarate dehydrogenase complex dihydrolipoyllysine-residue succinyltransferase [Brevundimonas subvibrioides]ADK99781.1 2-oxoglutarate dehydrogenase, E2 subunit, dihydrolipoamide succinyltransferase [Brevundimonas subvibrioides ATCC 15264]
MADILTPTLGESVSEATIAKWSKKVGDAVKKDEMLVELETDKVSLEVVSPSDGTLEAIHFAEGDTVTPGAVLGAVTEGAATAKPAEAAPAPAAAAAPAPAPAAAPGGSANSGSAAFKAADASQADKPLSPSVQRVVTENNLDASAIAPTGPKGNITKGDALAAIGAAPAKAGAPAPAPVAAAAPRADQPREERVKMTRLRQTIARRLKESQNTAAQLTTFNEVDMTTVMALRTQYKDAFEKAHGVKLGFMSFFTRAVVAALKEIPAVNAEIDGTDIIYKNHYDIGVAVGTEKGLVVPVLRDADTLSLAGIEKGIAALGKAARDGDLTLDQLQGGTFTITNGGTYGSLMSTPILNAPQSGILGMHNIVQRPMAVNGQVEIRPMMYLALSYDHRIVDGKEAVTFLVRIKQLLEDPARALLDL